MANLIDRISNIEKRLDYIEDQLGIEPSMKSTKKGKIEQEETVNGFTKSQLRVIYGWAKNTKIQHLSNGDFEELKKWDMLKEFYPDAPDNYEDIKL